jgi:hypothetical protein
VHRLRHGGRAGDGQGARFIIYFRSLFKGGSKQEVKVHSSFEAIYLQLSLR